MEVVLNSTNRYDLDQSKPVFVYKNLNNRCWSIRQDGLVKLHAKVVRLEDVEFKVSKTGRNRTLRERRKNVHAGLQGTLLWWGDKSPLNPDHDNNSMTKVTYNPYIHNSFVTYPGGAIVKYADLVYMNHMDHLNANKTSVWIVRKETSMRNTFN